MSDSGINRHSFGAKKQLLEKLLRQKAYENRQILPLSMGQTSVFLAHLEQPRGHAYNILFSFKILTRVSLPALEKSFQLLVDRHEILRTTYGFEKGMAAQTIHGHMDGVLGHKKVTGLDEAQIKHRLIMDSRHPFDLFCGPVIRACLYSRGQAHHYFLLGLHHIAGDARSLLGMAKELLESYGRLSQGQKISSFGMPRSQYRDFVQWEQDLLAGPQGKILETYWDNALSGKLPVLELPVSIRSEKKKAFNSLCVEVDRDLSDRLRAFARQRGIGFNTLIFSAFALLLHEYANQDDVLVGMPSSTLLSLPSDKVHPDVTGYLVNPVVIRSVLRKKVLSYLKELENTISMALDHQAYPFYKVQEKKSKEQQTPGAGIFTAMFNYLAFPETEILDPLVAPIQKEQIVRAGDLVLSSFPLPQQEGVFDLCMTITRASGSVYASLSFDENRFSPESIGQKLTDYTRLLNAMTQDPESDICDLLETCGIFGSPVLVENTRSSTDLCRNAHMTRNQLLTWMGQKLRPDIPYYSTPHLFFLTGPVQVANFLEAFDAIVRKSSSLRSLFVEKEGLPVRIVSDSPKSCRYFDFSRMSDAGFSRWIHKMVLKKFNLQKGAYRSFLIKRSSNDHIWFLNLHHLVVDGWSCNQVIFPLMSLFYEKAVQKKGLETPWDLDYETYLAWETENQDTLEFKISQRFWANRLKNKPDPIRFYDAYPDYQSTRVKRRRFYLGPPRTAGLVKMAAHKEFFTKNLNVSLVNIFTSLVFVLLHKISGNGNLSVGVNLHRRRDLRFKKTIGLVMYELPMVVTLAGDETFVSLNRQVIREGAAMVRHNDVTVTNPHDTPHYDVVINFISLNRPDFANVQISGGWIHSGHAQESLGFVVLSDLTQKNLGVGFDFKEAVFDDTLQKTVIRHFFNILDQFLADPHQRVREAALMSAREQFRMVTGFSGAGQAFPHHVTPISLFEEQARKYPEKRAVVCNQEMVTYGCLNQDAQKIGAYLADLGLGPEDRVGVCMGRSVDLICAILGIMKAGACYVPINPDHPENRKQFIMDDSGLSLMIFKEKQDLPQTATKVRTAAISAILADGPAAVPLFGRATPENSAYVTYTSGSTGMPKGVVVENKNLVNAYFAWQTAYGLKNIHSHLQMADFTFDVFAGDLVRALFSGAVLVICPKSVLLDPGTLFGLMEKEQVEFAEFVPAVLRLLADHLIEQRCTLAFLKILCCGSDTWYGEDCRAFLSVCGKDTRLINSFGITEATIDSTWYEVGPADLVGNRPIPIGKPFAHTLVYVVDKDMRPVPVGMPGELHIGGGGVARGYLNNPVLTQERFVRNPFSDHPGERLYKTGDLVKFLPDGNIQYMARMDHQVKIRGFRIEPGEIESCFLAHPHVKEAAVIAVNGQGKDMKLRAFVAFDGQDSETRVGDLPGYLKTHLPPHMVPHEIRHLPDLPRLSSGKIDKKALEQIQQSQVSTGHAPPEDQIEAVLLSVFCDALGIERMGMADNFFHCGGHSLLAAKIMSRIGQIFHVDLALSDLFNAPKLSDFARKVKSRLGGDKASVYGAIKKDAGSDRHLLSFGQKRLWFMEQFEKNTAVYNLFFALRLTGAIDCVCIEKSINQIIQRHDILRTRFLFDMEIPYCVVDPSLAIDVRVCDTTAGAVEKLLVAESQRPFDLEKGPLLRAKLFQISDASGKTPCHILFFNLHHIVSDGWSIPLFLREFSILYDGFKKGQAPLLERPPIQYADFARWQRDYLAGAVYDHQLGYWKEKLKGAPQFLCLPYDRPRPKALTSKGSIRYFDMDTRVPGQIQAISGKEGITLFIFLQTLFSILVLKLSNQTDILTGFPVAGRNHPQTHGLLGFFVNTLVLRTQVSESDTFLSLVRKTRQGVLTALACQDIPFERLIEQLDVQRNPGYHPLVQVGFSMMDKGIDALTMADVMIEEVPVKRSVSHNDLMLFMVESQGRLSGSVAYNSDLFNPETIDHMIQDFKGLVAQVAETPDILIADLVFTGKQANTCPENALSFLGSEKLLSQAQKNASRVLETPDITEQTLLAIWKSVLGRDALQIQDNFFESGGHSLLVIQVIKQVRETFGTEISIKDFFSAPTIVEFAIKIREAKQKASSDFPPIAKSGQTSVHGLTQNQQRLLTFEKFNAAPGMFNVTGALHFHGNPDPELLERCINEIIDRHSALRSVIFSRKDRLFQKVLPRHGISLPVLQVADEKEMEAILIKKAGQGFDFENGPLVDAAFLSGKKQVLFLNIHHIVSDGWSIHIFFKELCALYEAFRRNAPSPLAKVRRQFMDYAVWLDTCLKNGDFQGQIDYWKKKMAHLPPMLDLPLDRPRPEKSTFSGDVFGFSMDRALVKKLIGLSAGKHVSLFTVLYAGFVILLSKISNQTDILMAAMVANRNHPDTQGIFGSFANRIALRSDVGSDPVFSAFLDQAKQTLEQALMHQELPFERVIQEIATQRNLEAQPFFQVFIVFQTLLAKQLKIDNLDVTLENIPYKYAKQDMNLVLRQEADRIQGAIEFNTDLFFVPTIEWVASAYLDLLSQAADNPEHRISQLSVLKQK